MKGFRKPLWLIKWSKFEYWPWWFFYLPTLVIWLYLSLKSRSLLFFTRTNPGILYGGFFGESKSKILEMVSSVYLPKSISINAEMMEVEIKNLIQEASISVPFIVKPDVGERGNGVIKISSWEQFDSFLKSLNERYLIQEFIDYPIELGILCYRFPISDQVYISSITEKYFMEVTGDGQQTVLQLLYKTDRYRLQIQRLKEDSQYNLNYIPQKDQRYVIEPIGNHCRGTMFIDRSDLISEELIKVFKNIVNQMEGFYYGRFDLKVADFDSLVKGENIRIMEVNGVSSEPAHIYDPNFSVWKAYRVVNKHMQVVYKISEQNKQRGIVSDSPFEFVRSVSNHFY